MTYLHTRLKVFPATLKIIKKKTLQKLELS